MRSIFISVVGRTNAGKSSLVNLFVGEKVAIVTHKPQTTRSRITGIVTKGDVQYVFYDTPGLHNVRTKLGERMTSYAKHSINDVDLIITMFAPSKKFYEDELDFISRIKSSPVPAVAVLNKCDLLSEEEILSQSKRIEDTGAFSEVFCLSVSEKRGTDILFDALYKFSKEDVHHYPDESFTDLPSTAFVAEIVREKLLLLLEHEVPHGIAVTCERFKKRQSGIIDIDVDIVCEKQTHKGIIIGKGGKTLKTAATEARLDMEELFGSKVNLKCFVKVREDWRDSNVQLKNFGYKKDR